MFGRSTNPAKAVSLAEKELAALLSRGDSLTQRIAEAERLIEEHRVAAIRCALNGADPQELDRAELAKRAAEDRRSTLNNAHAELAGQITTAEGKLAAARDAQQREAFIAEVDKLERRVDAALPGFLEHVAALVSAVDDVGRLVPEAQGLAQFLGSCARDVPSALIAVKSTLDYHRQSVGSGQAIPAIAMPSEPPQPAPAPAEPTQQIGLLHDAKWSLNGKLETAGASHVVDVPVAVAQRAVAAGVAVADLQDPRLLRLRERVGGGWVAIDPRREDVVDLDRDPPIPPPPPKPVLLRRRMA